MSANDPKRTLPIERLRLGSLAHKHARHHAGYERESGNGVDRGGKTKRVRDQTCGERADCVTKVTPKAVDELTPREQQMRDAMFSGYNNPKWTDPETGRNILNLDRTLAETEVVFAQWLRKHRMKDAE